MHIVDRELKFFMLKVEIHKDTRFKNVNNLPLDIRYPHLVRVAMCISQKLNLDMNRKITKRGFTDSLYS